ncbi:arylsulfatase [Okeania sp. SIO2B3]|uniref:arylsulfatase n=1 Tax=Okeania sp. SIO2B3 TaxID=2607784 RepID=UPI0013C08084|nr:arylsulfatase [Okeania sp. SIO2B3]NET44379.1 arylsulfatase [Okeania sp. SIO2B3]
MQRAIKMAIAIAMSLILWVSGMLPWLPTSAAFAETTQLPNILVIMGDDIGLTNVSAYGKGIVGYDTPHIDRIANEGVLFTDYYAEQSCTAGRAAFITGQSGLRTGLLKVGFPGAPYGIQDEDPTLAEILKPLGYATGQFGKNHLGDQNQFLPTVHGFDEFFGNLYHLNAEEEPENVDYPGGPDGKFAKKFGPRGVLNCKASDVYYEEPIFDTDGNPIDDTTVIYKEPIFDKDGNPAYDEKTLKDINLDRFGKLGYQYCEDTGPLNIERMKDVDSEFLDRSTEFITNAVNNKQPFFTWFNSTRMHFYTHIGEDWEGKSGQDFYGDGMLEHDSHVGKLLTLLDTLKDENGVPIADNTIVIYTTDNGPHYNEWPDGALSPFRGEKNTNWEGGYRVPALVRWPGHIPAGVVSHEIFSHLDWVPTLMAAVGKDDIKKILLRDCLENDCTKFCGTHLDGYNQLPYLEKADKEDAKGARSEFIYFNDEGQLPGVRLGDWKVVYMEQRAHYFDVWREEFIPLRIPKLFNLRRDPYERGDTDSNNYNRWWVQRSYLLAPAGGVVEKFLGTFKDYPPSQAPFKANPNIIVEEIIDNIPKEEGAADTRFNQIAID